MSLKKISLVLALALAMALFAVLDLGRYLSLDYLQQSHTAFAEQALGHGVKLVVVTGGAKGAWGWNARTQAHVGRVAVDVVDTVGAGDTFQAAMLAWLAQHDLLSPEGLESLACESLYELLLYCANAAAITCSRRGADMPRLHELT